MRKYSLAIVDKNGETRYEAVNESLWRISQSFGLSEVEFETIVDLPVGEKMVLGGEETLENEPCSLIITKME